VPFPHPQLRDPEATERRNRPIFAQALLLLCHGVIVPRFRAATCGEGILDYLEGTEYVRVVVLVVWRRGSEGRGGEAILCLASWGPGARFVRCGRERKCRSPGGRATSRRSRSVQRPPNRTCRPGAPALPRV
jgi:hypothetical protein